MKVFYHGLQSFLAEDPCRATAPSKVYGYEWKQPPWDGYWMVSYLVRTGEVYALRWQHPERGFPSPLIVLCNLPDALVQRVKPQPGWEEDMDRLLDGWESAMRTLTLEWINKRLDDHLAQEWIKYMEGD